MVHFADEIWVNILQYVQLDLSGSIQGHRAQYVPRGRVQLPPGSLALSRLCRVSKRFQGLAEPILYEELPPWKGLGAASRLRLLLRTLCARRDIARRVKRLNYRTWLECYSDDLFWDFCRTGSELDILRIFQEVSLGFGPVEPHMILPKECLPCIAANLNRSGTKDDAQLAMLMIMLPNLERIEMYLPGLFDISSMIRNLFIWHAEEIQDSILTSVANPDLDRLGNPGIGSDMACRFPSTPLAHLKELDVRVQYKYDDPGYRERSRIQITELEPLLLHRGIHTLRAETLFWGAIPEAQPGWADKSLGLKHISITDAAFDAAGFPNMLSRCPALRTLEIRFGFAPQHIRATELSPIMGRYCKSLESLSLSGLTCEGEGLGSLRALHSLRKLAVTAIALLGPHFDVRPVMEDRVRLDRLLPASLEVLHLDEEWMWGGNGAALLERSVHNLPVEGHLPNLREVRWEYGQCVPTFSKDFACPGWVISEDGRAIVLTKVGLHL